MLKNCVALEFDLGQNPLRSSDHSGMLLFCLDKLMLFVARGRNPGTTRVVGLVSAQDKITHKGCVVLFFSDLDCIICGYRMAVRPIPTNCPHRESNEGYTGLCRVQRGRECLNFLLLDPLCYARCV